MSTGVVVEAPPPAVAGEGAAAAMQNGANATTTTTTAMAQENGAQTPDAVATEKGASASPSAKPVDDDADVEMTSAEDAGDDANGLKEPDVVVKKEAIAAVETAADESEPTAMDVDSTGDNEVKPEEPERVPVEYTVRAPEDDARAIALAKRRLEIQIAFVENAKKKIEDESHPDFLARMVHVDAERERLLELAVSQENYWAHCTSVIFAYECEEATSEYMMNCDKLRQEMLDEIHQEMEILNDQRKGNSSARKTTRKTRSARSKGGAGNGSEEKTFSLDSTTQKVKKRVGNVFQHLENKLAQSEVDHDLRELHNSIDAVSKKRRIDATQSPIMAKYHRSNFLYRDSIYQEGDEIFVRNLMNGSEYIAIICSITSTELFVLSEKGKYFRLVFMDLRQGRVLVSALTPEQTAALNEREALRM